MSLIDQVYSATVRTKLGFYQEYLRQLQNWSHDAFFFVEIHDKFRSLLQIIIVLSQPFLNVTLISYHVPNSQ